MDCHPSPDDIAFVLRALREVGGDQRITLEGVPDGKMIDLLGAFATIASTAVNVVAHAGGADRLTVLAVLEDVLAKRPPLVVMPGAVQIPTAPTE